MLTTHCALLKVLTEADSGSDDLSVNPCGTPGEHRILTVTLDADLI